MSQQSLITDEIRSWIGRETPAWTIEVTKLDVKRFAIASDDLNPLYLDDESEKRLRTAAKKAGMPVSRWVVSLVQEKTRAMWPDSVRKLAGAWQDFPDLKTIRKTEGKDTAREPL